MSDLAVTRDNEAPAREAAVIDVFLEVGIDPAETGGVEPEV